MDMLQQLEDLLKNPELFKKAQKAMKVADSKKAPEVETGNGFSNVRTVIHCIHCGSVQDRNIRLTPKEEVFYTDKEGNAKVVRLEISHEEKVIDVYCNWCSDCQAYIEQMSAYELRTAYMDLLKQVNLLKSTKKKEMEIKIPGNGAEIPFIPKEECDWCSMFDEDMQICRTTRCKL